MRMNLAAALVGGVFLMACSAAEDVSAMDDTSTVPAAEASVETDGDTTDTAAVSETTAVTEIPAETTEAPVSEATVTEAVEATEDAPMCAQDYAPVCGADGETYGNACEAQAAGIEVSAEGECHPEGAEEH